MRWFVSREMFVLTPSTHGCFNVAETFSSVSLGKKKSENRWPKKKDYKLDNLDVLWHEFEYTLDVCNVLSIELQNLK